MAFEDLKIAVIGLGYVGLPLAVEFGNKFPVTGFDIDPARIFELKQGMDSTKIFAPKLLCDVEALNFTSDEADIAGCNCYIVTVPTPIDKFNRPDLRALQSASETVGRVLKKGDCVIFESTVYPGCTEDECIPIIERASHLSLNEDFICGYSPERINPGDPDRGIKDIKKVTSGSNADARHFIDSLYQKIIKAGTYKAESIRVAEAAKVIENTQRDLNIALVNELAIIFNGLGIDSEAVLRAAETKWNFLPFRPGLVGGHCISVDPYYLAHKAQEIGHHPEMILAARRVNDGMGAYVASQLVKKMTA
ncbi:MAG: nucleotide sugar dehydrogenase, partial [Halioglobus sp.]|nr:nucleotide sugar dehydrogenase [Halioglobus sp.]